MTALADFGASFAESLKYSPPKDFQSTALYTPEGIRFKNSLFSMMMDCQENGVFKDSESKLQEHVTIILTEIVEGSKGLSDEYWFKAFKRKIQKISKKKPSTEVFVDVTNAKIRYLKSKGDPKVMMTNLDSFIALVTAASSGRNRMGKCANIWCDQKHRFKCSKCKSTFYCSQQCNKMFWTFHRFTHLSEEGPHGNCDKNCLHEVD